MTRPSANTDQRLLGLDAMPPTQSALFDAAVAAAAEKQALRWRFRLVVIESVMMAGLVLVAGLFLNLPSMMVIRASLSVGMACFLSGLLLIWLSGVSGRLISRWRNRGKIR